MRAIYESWITRIKNSSYKRLRTVKGSNWLHLLMKRFDAPQLRRDFVIVANHRKWNLAAAALSYIYKPDSYLPMFSFRDVDVPESSPVLEPDVYALQRRRSNNFNIFLNNAIVENGGCDNLILLGLSPEQKSYLDVVQHYHVLDIDNDGDLQAYLGGFAVDKNGELECSEEQAINGLCTALGGNLILKIGVHNHNLEDYLSEPKSGIVVVEHVESVDLVTSINYAFSIDATLKIVKKLAVKEEDEVLHHIERWAAGEPDGLVNLKARVDERISDIDFSAHAFVTFFTKGLPYSLVVSDIPVSYVRLGYLHDFFIHNALLYEKNQGVGAAVVFSPVFFENEETYRLLNLLEFENYYVRKVLSDGATNYNLKNTIECFPFDFLHICSHGGDVGGTTCVVNFTDSQNLSHVIEFDHVLSIALTPYQDKHAVESLYYFRSFNGFPWRSAELRAQNYSHELYASIIGQINSAFDNKQVVILGKTSRVVNANAINCIDFPYMGHFDQVGSSNVHPLIFNNTCWSWMNVSDSFLTSGCRAYIGTLRDVPNKAATRFAQVFYDAVFNSNVIDAFYEASIDFKKSLPDTIYMFWGLHFSTLKNRNPVHVNRKIVMSELSERLVAWKIKRKRGQGSPSLVQGKILNTRWIVTEVIEGDLTGHEPRNKPRDLI